LSFREQVNNFVAKIQGEYTEKINELESTLKLEEGKNRDLQ
jgi:hypothetical protein